MVARVNTGCPKRRKLLYYNCARIRRITMLPVVFNVVPIGAGQLSVMAKPASGERIEEEFAGLKQLGIDHVVSLLERPEQIDVGLADEAKLCERNGMRYTSFQIVDRDVPQQADARPFVAGLYQDISNGEHVVIHCRVGIGRTGIIASAILIHAGHSSGEAIHMVSFARGMMVPDTQEQVEWVDAFAAGPA
jgi:protein-tyrosine phosphatase